MAKEIIWSENMEYAYGVASEFENKDDFIETVKSQYEEGDCLVVDIKIEPCIFTEEGISSETLVPLALTDVVIENYYTATVSPVEDEEDYDGQDAFGGGGVY